MSNMERKDASPAAAVWTKACRHLRDTLSKDVYDRWIAVIEARGLDDGVLTLSVANNFYQTWLEENYLPLIEKALAATGEAPPRIAFFVDRVSSEPAPRRPLPPRPPDRVPSPRVSHPLNLKYTFDTFVVGPSNSFAHAAALAVAQSPAKAYNPLFLYGASGLGKTHLMQAIGHAVNPAGRASICYTTSEAFTNEYIEALQRKGLVQFRKKYRGSDILLIDDVQFLGGKERMQEEFFHTFNALFDGHKQIVLTCDRPASEIPGLEHRLVSRFEWGLVTELELPDLETRTAILLKKQEELGLSLPGEVIAYLASNIRSSIRRLEGALTTVISYTSLTRQPLTRETLERLLSDMIDQEKAEVLPVEEIQRVVADHYDIRLADMTSPRRPQAIAFPRQVAMYLSRELTDRSLPSIGAAFGRNHATVLHACRLVQKRLTEDASLRQTLATLQHKLSRPR